MKADTIVITIVGAVLSAVVTYLISRRHSSLQDILIGMQKEATISPRMYNLEGPLRLSYSMHGTTQPIDMLCIYELWVKNKGNKDLHEDQNIAESNPRIDLKGGRAIGVRTVDMDNSQFYIPIGRGNSDRSIHINFGRLKSGAIAHFMIMCIPDQQDTEIEFSLFTAFVPNFNVKGEGLVSGPTLTR